MEINQEQRLTYKRQFIDFLDDEVSSFEAEHAGWCFQPEKSVYVV